MPGTAGGDATQYAEATVSFKSVHKGHDAELG
jgi:hypothetical protein